MEHFRQKKHLHLTKRKKTYSIKYRTSVLYFGLEKRIGINIQIIAYAITKTLIPTLNIWR